MTKFIKSLIIINGLIIPAGILVLIVVFIISLFPRSSDDQDSVALNNVIANNGDTLIIQGLKYNDPEPIYNSNNFCIKIMAKTYENPLKIGSGSSYERGSYDSNDSYLNILFLDSKYNVISRLLDKKAFISSMLIPSDYNEEKIDTTIKNIGYLIAFADSNNDKKLDENDYRDLYISDLEGKGLLQVTKDIDVLQFSFKNNHKDIFISYTERIDTQDEYKIKRFSVYNIKLNQYTKLSSIDKALSGVQQILKKDLSQD
jgi:hypothetical protein